MDERAEAVERILAELQAGAAVEENFRRLCALYTRPLYHFFARRGLPHQDCLDLTQETFLGIYRGIGSFRGEARFETWLFKVATNAWRKGLRREGAAKRAGEEVALGEDEERGAGGAVEPAAAAPPPGEGLLREERARLVRAAVERLPEQMRRCLVLRLYHEMTYREIALVLRLSPETVKAHLFQARRRLQDALGDYVSAAGAGSDRVAS
jgi:RNA polymerase sigma-70 factor (ECF subfamily)